MEDNFIINDDNLKKLYGIAQSKGMPDSYEDLRNYLSQSEDNRRKFYEKMSSLGMPDSYEDYSAYIGRVDVSDVQQAEQGNTPVTEATEIPTVTMDQVEQQPTSTPAQGSDGHFLGNISVGADGQPKPMEENSLRNTDNQPAEERTIPEIEVQKQKVDEISQALSDATRQRNEQRAQQQREKEEEIGFWGRMAKGLQAAENPITSEVVDVITDPTDNDLRAAQNEVRSAKKQLQLEEMRQNGEMKGLAFIRGLETANYYDLIPVLGTADAMSILALSQALKEGKELTESQQLLLQAMEARAGVDFNYKDNNTIWERVGQSTPEQLMFTLQFVLGAGLTGATEAGERIAAKQAQKAAIRYAKKGVNSGARRFIGGTVLPKLEGMAVSSTIQTFANPLSLASMAEDFERRYAGDIYYDNEGNLHVFDNDRSAGQAAYQAIASAWIENFTEYSGQNITKSIRLADGKMFDLAGKFDNVMKNVGGGRIKDVFTVPQKLSHLTQIGSAPEEFLEEELGSVMNALFTTDAQRGESYGDAFKRTISQSFSGEQQLETLLSVTITSTLLGGGGNAVNAVGNAGYRREVNREVERSKALLGKVHGIDIAELDNQIENGQISDIASYLKEQSDANGWSQDEQGAAVSYVLNRARQIGIKHNDDIAIEEAQQEMRQQAEDMANRWDGNIYNATWKDNEGNEQPVTIINGRIHYNTRENGTIHFDPYTSSGMIAIRLSDGTKKQVPSRTITGIQSVMSVDEQLEAQGNTIPQMMQAQFEQEGMAIPTVESVWGGNLVANETQFYNGKYTYLGKDQNGLYAFANNDKKTQKDNPIVYMTERQLVEYGLSLNIQAANATGDNETAQQAQDDLDFMQHLDELTAEATEKDQWDVLKAYASLYVGYDENGSITPESNPQAYAPYLLACSEGSFENAIASIDESIAVWLSQVQQQSQSADISDDAAMNAETHANMESIDGQAAGMIDFYTNVRNILLEMQQGQQEAIEESVNETPVSQMEGGTEFPVMWNGQEAVAKVVGIDADGRRIVYVRDMDGNDLEAGIDDMTDEQWEAVRVKGEAANMQPAEQNAPEIEQELHENEQDNEPELHQNEQQEEVSVSPAQQTFDGLVQKYGDKAGHKIDVTAEDKSKTLDKAKKALEKAQTDYDDAPIGKEEKAEAALQKAQQEYNTALAEKQEWDEVKAVKDRFVAERLAAQQAADEERHAQAVAEEETRRAEEERKAREREATGANNVAPNIREKWEGAPRVEGNADEITLANGERIAGHYVLVESGAASASHDALHGFAKTEGFPLDENEQSVNDRDYERDQNAQQITRQIAAEYDSRALQQPVVVSQDGVVLSGNGRTMAGEIAAAQDTDGAYIDYLKKYAPKYGFTPEQVEGMAHPRVVFVPDASMPYTAETFAKFNQQEMKGQSKTEQAVKLGKLVDDATFGRIIRSINRFDTLGDFYADTNATADAIGELLKAGAINQMQHTEMFDGDAISAQGREILENMLIGKAFESNPDAVRQLAAYKSLRQSVITALAEISNNIALGEYSLESELSDAIALAYNARKNGYKAGDAVSEFARQGKLFETEEDATAIDEMIDKLFGTIEEKQDEQGNAVLYHKVGEEVELTKEEIELRDHIVGFMKEFLGEDSVITDSEEAQRVLDEANGTASLSRGQKRALETASVFDKEKHQPTVVSSADGAKILNNLDATAKEFENLSNQTKQFIGKVAKALGAKRYGSGSEYATFETKNGQIVTIRLADHNATVSNFDYSDKDNGISIVITPKKNEGMTNDGNAHIVEFYYDAIKLRKAEGKPLADIVRSIQQALYSGEYIDNTGLAEREEVNPTQIREQRVNHNSPHLIKKADGTFVDPETGERLGFDHRFMSTGEGIQAHGWGSYFSVEDLRHYADDLNNPNTPPMRAAMRQQGRRWLEENPTFEAWKETKEFKDYYYNHEDSAFKYIEELKTRGPEWQADIEDIEKRIEERRRQREDEDYLRKQYGIEREAALTQSSRHHYDVEIPDDNGTNYFEENEPMKPEQIAMIQAQSDKEGAKAEVGGFLFYANPEKNPYADRYTFRKFLNDITSDMGGGLTAQQASEFFHRAGFTGIHYIGQRDGEGYVIFNENDAKITDHIRFFRTPSGEAYGFTVGGKVYIDPRIATAETPIHEYAHLYGEAIRRAYPEAWEHLKQDLLGHKDVLDYVKGLYPQLEGDELMDEVWAHFSGKRGADYMRAEQKRMMDEAEGFEGVSRVAAIFDRIRKALKKFWNMARDLFAGKNEKLKDMKAEDIADMMMNDFANKFDPRTVKGKEGAKPQSDEVKYSMIGRQGAQRLDMKERAMTRLNNLHTAREMEQQGKDAKAIRLATGWERGKDGKWRFEIPDYYNAEEGMEALRKKTSATRKKLIAEKNKTLKKYYQADERYKDFGEKYKDVDFSSMPKDDVEKIAMISLELGAEREKYLNEYKEKDKELTATYEDMTAKLSELVGEDPPVFTAYPQLKDIKVVFKALGNRVAGSYNTETNTITINGIVEDSKLNEIVAHEVQHAIQGIEGFAQGTNIADAKAQTLYKQQQVEKISKQIEELEKQLPGMTEPWTEEHDKIMEQIEKLRDEQLNIRYNMDVSREAYRSAAGEVEARNVEKRLNMTDDERREALLADTEDVAREDQIVLMEGSEAMSASEGEENPVEPVSEEELNSYDSGRMSHGDIVANTLVELANKNKENVQRRIDAVRALGNSLQKVRQAMAAQRAYDKTTVDQIVRLAQIMMKGGMFKDFSNYEVRRLLSMAKNANGKNDISKQANAVVNLMLDHALKEAESILEGQMKVKGSKVNASGVEVQAGLDITGQRTVKAMKEGIELDEAALAERIADVNDRMGGTDKTLAANAAEEYEGLMMAKDYHDMIRQSEQDEAQLRHELDQAKEDVKNGTLGRKEYKELAARIDAALRKNMAERVTAFTRLNQQLAEVINGSKGRAREFREKQMEMVREIQHNANSDMKGTPASEHKKAARINKVVNSGIVRFLFKPVATFDEMLRFFGKKSVDGMGYLWQRFMGGYIDAADTEWRSLKKDHDALDEKVSEVMGEKMRWSDLFSMERKMDPIEVEFYDTTTNEDGEAVRLKEKHPLTQGNALYIYMVNKMDDGAMKLRRMGITDEDVDRIAGQLDPRFLQLADWIQDEFLPKKREAFNAVHMRMFGAPMAAIEEYFPLVTNSRSRGKDEDISEHDKGETKPSTITGSIIKRTVNTTPLDVTNADAFDVLLGHLRDMEHWAAFAELNRDMNTLLSYKRFKNQVLNTSSVRFGAGETLWNNFKDVCAIAADVYHPKVNRQSLDNAIVNISKGVTSAKISFRLYTALKQLLSYPAYFSEANPIELAKSTGRPAKAFNWALDNLPGFAERWQSRQAGDSRLKDTDADWDFWKNKFVDTARRWGMTPNAFVDGITVAMGAKAIYESKMKGYLKAGYSEAEAKEKALKEASAAVNETQQSSQNAYLSAMQLDRTVASVALTVFRNASMGYERRLLRAVDNIKRKFTKGYKEESIEFMRKKMVREGLTEEQAKAASERAWNISIAKDVANLVIFGFVMQLAWNLGSSLMYLVFGDDDDEKGKMWEDAAMHALAGPVEGLSGGSVISEVYNMARSGKKISNYNFQLLPIMSDLQTTMRHMEQDKVRGMQDIVNLVIQAGVGVNPQTITDAAVAIVDAADGDLGVGKEIGMLMLRIAQVPQSQLDQLYIDELGMSAREAKGLPMEELAQRYAAYKRMKDAPLTGWAYSDEAKEKVDKRYLNKFVKLVQERIANMDDEQLEWMMDGDDMSMKRYIGKEVADRLEGKDTYGSNPQSNWKEETKRAHLTYQRLRGYVDLCEDVVLQKAQADADRAYEAALEAGELSTAYQQQARAKGIEKARQQLNKMRHSLGLNNGLYDEQVMENIRRTRRAYMEAYGLVGKKE